jgi:hypothetical protein
VRKYLWEQICVAPKRRAISFFVSTPTRFEERVHLAYLDYLLITGKGAKVAGVDDWCDLLA